MATDFFGNEIIIGCEVAFMQTKYRNLRIGKIKSISEKTVLIEHPKSGSGHTGYQDETRQDHKQVIVKLTK